jgi:hypothetical protein
MWSSSTNFKNMKSDSELIHDLGGAAKVADLLGYKKPGGVQRVHNWISRGIPAQVKITFPHLFLRLREDRRTTEV